MTIVLVLLTGMITGFAVGANNTTRSLKEALTTGILFATLMKIVALLTGIDSLTGTDSLLDDAYTIGIVVGSVIAGYTPNNNPVKRWFASSRS